MDIGDIAKIREKIAKSLSKKRFEHTLSVSYTAASLCLVYSEDPFRALAAGLLHDSAKCLSIDEQLSILSENGYPVTDELLKASKVTHAKAGVYIARNIYKIEDEDILSAISYHTTGRPCMGQLEKIIFVSDYIEPLRDEFKNLRDIRKLAFRDLDECVYRILTDTIESLSERGLYIYEDTLKAFSWYQKERTL